MKNKIIIASIAVLVLVGGIIFATKTNAQFSTVTGQPTAVLSIKTQQAVSNFGTLDAVSKAKAGMVFGAFAEATSSDIKVLNKNELKTQQDWFNFLAEVSGVVAPVLPSGGQVMLTFPPTFLWSCSDGAGGSASGPLSAGVSAKCKGKISIYLQ